jgi:HK97 family phage prohead protease
MPLPLTERRFIIAELRADSQGDELTLVGYASVFNSQSEDLGGFRETVMPGAFARSIREGADVKCLMNHDPSLVLGRVKNGTLRMEEDSHGLKFRCALPPTQTGRDLYTLVKRGDIDSCSFAFIPKDQSWEDVRSAEGELYASRRLMDVDLLDVSAVTNPAYASTSLNARALFPDGEPVEMRSAINAIVAKREVVPPVVETRSDIPMPYAISMPQPFASDMKQDWWDAFAGAYIEALHVLKQKGQVALATGIAAANLAVQPDTETDPEVAGQHKNPSDLPHEVIDTARALVDAKEENRKKKEAAVETKSSDGDVSNPDSPDYDPDDPDYDPKMDYSSDEYEGERKSAKAVKATEATPGDDGGEPGAKEVNTAPLSKKREAADCAWVGDVNDASTWKLRVDTEPNTKSALHRFKEAKGIPEDKKEMVWRNIVSACKKFGIVVTEEDSLRAAISHDVATAILNEVTFDKDAENLRAYVRMLELDLELE